MATLAVEKYLEAIAAGVVAGTAIIGSTFLSATVVLQLLRSIGMAGDMPLWISLVLLVVLMILLIASSGALAIKLSYPSDRSLIGCIILSEVAGLTTVLTATVLSILLLSFFAPLWSTGSVPSIDVKAIFVDTIVGTLTNVWMVLETLAVSAFAVIGGLAYRARASRKAATSH